MFLRLSRLLLFSLMGLTLLLMGCSEAPEGNPIEGKRWFAMYNCAGCHGENGNDGKAVVVKNLDMSFGSFVRKLRTDDAPIMPHFPEEKVSKQDAADIYAFLTEEP